MGSWLSPEGHDCGAIGFMPVAPCAAACWRWGRIEVKPFDDAAFFGKVNDYQVVNTQFGVHLIQVTKRGPTVQNVQLATIVRNIEPSSQTYQQTYSVASKFAAENRDIAH